MEGEKPRRVSLISIILLFLIIIVITTLVINKLYATNEANDNLSLIDVNSPEYIASKQVEIESYMKSLNDIYGINIFYGEDTLNYANKVDATIVDDLNVVNNNIKIIFHTLEKYPKNMFEPFRNKEYKFDVVLLDKFNNNNIALASKNNLKEVKLYVSNAEDFERAVHHEIFHIFEYYMTDKNKEVFSNWEDLNPKGFAYESNVSKLDSSYVYLKKSDVDTKKTNDSYFVTKYAKASAKEDRAETFAEIMMLTKKPEYLESNTNIRSKVNNIIDTMSNYFKIKNLYCIKFIY